MADRSNEAGGEHQERKAGLSRRNVLILGLGGLAAVCTGTYLGLRNDGQGKEKRNSTLGPVELPAEATPGEKARIIASALSDGRKVTGVNVAIDYNIFYHSFENPGDDSTDNPDGISNPLILDENTYGYTIYDATTGKASVLIVPEGGTLTEVPSYAYDPAESNAPKPNPHIEMVSISRVYYESTVYDPSDRFYVTAIGEQPGPIPNGRELTRAGEPLQIGATLPLDGQ